MKTILTSLVVAMGSLGPASPAAQGQIDPRGLYFHQFTGSVAGTEWSTWGQIIGVDRYNFADFSASGSYNATVSPAGAVVFDGGIGGGQFSDADTHALTFTFPGLFFSSMLKRAPYTDTAFPVFLSTPVVGDALVAGSWDAQILDVDPDTGATLGSVMEVVQVVVTGTTVRITREDGTYFQAAWKTATQAGFRVIDPPPPQARYRTFPGSETSESVDLVGELVVVGPNAMTVSLFTQTRTPFGQQMQAAVRMVLSRTPPPSCAGDINSDGITNAADFVALAGSFGVGPGAMRNQGDLNGDGFVNAGDFVLLAGDFGCGP